MAIDRRKSAAKRFEDDRKKKAAAAAKKAEQEKKAAAKKAAPDRRKSAAVRFEGERKEKAAAAAASKKKQQQAAFREVFNQPLNKMSRNSTDWDLLERAKASAKTAKWSKPSIDRMTAKQNELHQKNVEIAKPYDVHYDAVRGTWNTPQGTPAYEAKRVIPPRADAQQSLKNMQAVHDIASRSSLPLPKMTPAQLETRNRALTARSVREVGRTIDSLSGHLSGRWGSGAESIGKNVAATPWVLSETLDQALENEKANFSNKEIRALSRELAELNRELNVRGLPAAMREEKLNRLREVQEQIEALRAKTGVDMSLPGQQLLAQGNAAGEKTLEGMTGLPRKAAGVAIGLGENIPGMAATAAAGPVVGGLVMGGQAAAKKMYELNARGLPAGESFGRGIVSGGIEGLTEKFSLGNWDKIAKSGGKSWVKDILKQAGIEASEESASYVLNYIADKVAKDPEAQFSLAELADTALSASLSGGVMAGVGKIGNTVGRMTNHAVDTVTQPIHNAIADKWAKHQEILDRLKKSETPPSKPVAQENWALPQDVQNEINNPESAVADVKMQEPETQTPEQETAIDTNPEAHTPEQMQTIREYTSSVDAGLKNFAQDVISGKQAETYKLGNVSDRAAQDIQAITGVDATGFETKIEPRMISHIWKRHGANGAADSSMANLDDIARMQYVIENYDSMEDGGQVQSYKEPKPGNPTQNRAAKSVVYIKKVDGSYYVVQAVPDTKKKCAYVVSAYIQKNAEPKNPATSQDASGSASAVSMIPQETHSIHDASNAPGYTSKNDSTTVFPTDSIPQNAGESKAGLTMEYGKPKAENSQAIGRAEKPGLTIAYGKPQAEETAIDTNPKTHTPEQTSIEKPKTLNDRIKENSDLFEKNGTLFEMTGNEFAQSDKKLIDQVTEFFNSIGNKVFRKNFGEVTLTRSGARDSISHGIGREKAIAFAAVPDVIEKGQVIDEQANWKGRRYDTVTFGGRIKIAGQDYDMGVIVKRYDNPAMASKYYVHEVMLANKEGEASTFKTGTEPAEPVGYPSDVTSPSTDSIPQTAGESKAKLTMEYGKPQAEVPDPGILKQGDGWQAGEVKSRLGGEHEVRPENVQKIILEENPEMMQALGEAQGRAQEELIKLPGQQMPKIAIGDKVRARGLRNLGTIIGLNADGTYEVEFHNKQTDANKVVTMPAEAFETIWTKELPPPDAKSIQQAQEQQGALESDSYKTPDNLRAAEEAETRAANAAMATDQMEQLRSDSYDVESVETVLERDFRESLEEGRRVAASRPELMPRIAYIPGKAEGDNSGWKNAYQTVTSPEVNAIRYALPNLAKRLGLTEAQIKDAELSSKGAPMKHKWDKEEQQRISAYEEMLLRYDEAMHPVHEYWKRSEESRLRVATEIAKESYAWKDTPAGLVHAFNAPKRVVENVCGEEAGLINDNYIEPVVSHEADRIRYLNELHQDFAKIIDDVTHETSVYTHMHNRLKWLRRSGHKSLAEKLEVQMADYLKKNHEQIQTKRVDQLEVASVELTKRLYPEICAAYVRNGYDVPAFLDNYIPSNAPTSAGGRFAQFLRNVAGIETTADELPTQITGTTMDRIPGRSYFAAEQHRTGMNTEFDLIKAMQNYFEQASNVIFHTDDIQNLRALEDRIRYQYSDEATRVELDGMDVEYRFDVEGRIQAKSEIWEATIGNLPSFPSWLRDYTNQLAGKKGMGDRNAERGLSRGIYRFVETTENAFARSALGANPSSALSNFIALFQGSAELRPQSILRAMLNYGKDSIHGKNSFKDVSNFLTNRSGVEVAYKGGFQKASDALFVGMQLVDDISSNTLVRARYYDNIMRGMESGAALREADDWASRLMGDRSKGSVPLAFASKSPVMKAVSMFGLEPTNSVFHVLHDLPEEARVGGAGWLVGTLAKIFVMSYLANDVYEKVNGQRPVQDPIGVINGFCGRLFGFALPNTIDLLKEAISGELDIDDFKTEKTGLGSAIFDTAADAAGYLPVVGNIAGSVLGSSSTRFPIAGILPDMDVIKRAMDGEGTAESRRAGVGKELSKPAFGLLPAGNQIRKTLGGLRMVMGDGGRYGYDRDGKRVLQFPAYGTGPETARALLFGPSATEAGRKWIDSDFTSGLDAATTRTFQALVRDHKVNPKTAHDALRSLQAVQKDWDKQGFLSKTDGIRKTIYDLKIGADAKTFLDTAITGKLDAVDYSDRGRFIVTSAITDRDQRASALKLLEDGANAETLVKLIQLCNVPSGGDAPEKSEQFAIALGSIYDSDLTDEQQQVVAREYLMPRFGKKFTGEGTKSYLDGVDPREVIHAKLVIDEIERQIDADTSIADEDKSERTDAAIANFFDQPDLNLDENGKVSLQQFLHGGKLANQWSDLGQNGNKNEKRLAWSLEQTGMDLKVYNQIKTEIASCKGEKDVPYSKKIKVIAVLSKYDLTPEQKQYILEMTTDYDDFKTGRSRLSGKSSGRNGKGSGSGKSSKPQRLKTLKPLDLPF